MLDRLLPDVVGSAESRVALPEPLYPEEEQYLAGAVETRREQFRTVRGCARLALAQLGLHRPPMVPGRAGAPVWPPGIVGAMTHCGGYHAAAVAWRSQVRGLGLDADRHLPLRRGALALLATPDDRRHLERLHRDQPSVCWDRLLFSAKESAYKVWFPATGVPATPQDVDIVFDPAGEFDVRVTFSRRPDTGARHGLTRLSGRWLVHDDLVLTVALAG